MCWAAKTEMESVQNVVRSKCKRGIEHPATNIKLTIPSMLVLFIHSGAIRAPCESALVVYLCYALLNCRTNELVVLSSVHYNNVCIRLPTPVPKSQAPALRTYDNDIIKVAHKFVANCLLLHE